MIIWSPSSLCSWGLEGGKYNRLLKVTQQAMEKVRQRSVPQLPDQPLGIAVVPLNQKSLGITVSVQESVKWYSFCAICFETPVVYLETLLFQVVVAYKGWNSKQVNEDVLKIPLCGPSWSHHVSLLECEGNYRWMTNFPPSWGNCWMNCDLVTEWQKWMNQIYVYLYKHG